MLAEVTVRFRVHLLDGRDALVFADDLAYGASVKDVYRIEDFEVLEVEEI